MEKDPMMHIPKTLLPSDNSIPDKAISERIADAALPETTEFRLSAVEWEAFCQRLDAPPRSIPALVQLFSETGPFQR